VERVLAALEKRLAAWCTRPAALPKIRPVALAAKLEGAQVLDALTRELPLDFFLLFSSAAGTWGAAGKPMYGAANAALDASPSSRRAAGLPALAVAWGRFNVRGLLSIEDDAALERMGLLAMEPAEAFALAWRATGGTRAHLVSHRSMAALPCRVRGARPTAILRRAAGGRRAHREDRGTHRATRPAADPGQRARIGACRRRRGSRPRRCRRAARRPGTLRPRPRLAARGAAARRRSRRASAATSPTAVLFAHPTIRALAALARPPIGARCGRRQAAGTRPPSSPIRVIGIGCRFPGGVASPDAFETHALAMRNAIAEVPADRWDWRAWKPEGGSDAAPNRWGGFVADVDQFDARFFGIAPKEAAFMDPQQRLLLENCVGGDRARGHRAAHARRQSHGCLRRHYGKRLRHARAARPRDGPRRRRRSWASRRTPPRERISFTLGLTGPAFVRRYRVLVVARAIHLACRALRAGECESALAGGVKPDAVPGPR
jgi:hypothetical protein